MVSPYGSQPVPDQPGFTPPPASDSPAGPGAWAPLGQPATSPSSVPPGQPTVPPLQGYAVPGSWSAPAWQGPGRPPGTVTAAAVITYIQAGLSILFSVLALAAAPAVNRATDGELADLLQVTALITLGVGVLYIVAAVQLQRGRSRAFLLWLTIVSIAIDVLSTAASVVLVASGTASSASSTICSLILPVVVLILLMQPATTQWIEAHRGR